MKLRQTIIDKLKGSRPFRFKVADGLGFSEVWVDRLIVANKDNGPLTTAKSLSIIREELGTTDEEILEEETVKV